MAKLASSRIITLPHCDPVDHSTSETYMAFRTFQIALIFNLSRYGLYDLRCN